MHVHVLVIFYDVQGGQLAWVLIGISQADLMRPIEPEQFIIMVTSK